MLNLSYRRARESDWAAVAALLREASLPLDGAQDHLTDFWLAFKHSTLVGCAGLERYGTVGLLRSVAVRELFRGQGLGQALTERVLSQAKHEGLQQVVLLTETAQGFFPKFGFAPIGRAQVPPPALASVEFTTACPESALVMMRAL